jgi:hypothetical protein
MTRNLVDRALDLQPRDGAGGDAGAPGDNADQRREVAFDGTIGRWLRRPAFDRPLGFADRIDDHRDGLLEPVPIRHEDFGVGSGTERRNGTARIELITAPEVREYLGRFGTVRVEAALLGAPPGAFQG